MVMSVRDWAQRFSEASDRDQTIGAMARYFTCTYLWDMGTAKVIVRMIDGKVHSAPFVVDTTGTAPAEGSHSDSTHEDTETPTETESEIDTDSGSGTESGDSHSH